ncbi:hypothetical protein, partial [Escherichia coli]|uniref:hypothetical protein n=1 Tax=Escherichia coli TaxID=562 RepID=UPI001A7E115A
SARCNAGASYQAYIGAGSVDRIRRSRRIRHTVSDATLPRLIGPTKVLNRRPDKAFTPHPASG